MHHSESGKLSNSSLTSEERSTSMSLEEEEETEDDSDEVAFSCEINASPSTRFTLLFMIQGEESSEEEDEDDSGEDEDDLQNEDLSEQEASRILEKMRIVEEDEEFERAFKNIVQVGVVSVDSSLRGFLDVILRYSIG